MTGKKDIDMLQAQLAQTTSEREEAEATLELLNKYAIAMGPDSKRYTDRLLQLAEKLASDYYRAWALLHLGIIERTDGDYERSANTTQQALLLFESIKDTKGLTKAYNNIGNNFFFRGIYPEALKNYFEALQIGQASDDKTGIASSYNNIGIAYDRQGNYPEALKSHFDALQIREILGDDSEIATSYINIGTIYCYQENYPEALSFFLKVLHIRKKAGDKKNLAGPYNNIGVVYKYQGNYPEALKNYSQALQISRESNNKDGVASAYNNIGAVLVEQHNYTEALKNYLLAFEIYKEMGDNRGLLACYNNLGEVYEKQGDYDEAVKSQLLAFKTGNEIGNKELIRECSLHLYNTYKSRADFANALIYYEKFHEVEKELIGEQAQKQLTNLNFQHNMEQKEKEAEIERLKNVELKEALDKLKREQLRSEQLFQNQVQELKSSALQAQMNPHFVFNSLNSIQQFIWEKAPEEATAYLSRFSKLIRAVLDNSRKQFVTLEQDLITLDYYIELEALRFENKFEYRIVCDSSVDKRNIQLPPMIIQPFVENAIIHGLQSLNITGKLRIELKRAGVEVLLITIEDNGIGRDKANVIKLGNGKSHHSLAMELTKERLEKMNGGLLNDDAIAITDLFDEYQKPAGTRVEIKVPVEFPD